MIWAGMMGSIATYWVIKLVVVDMVAQSRSNLPLIAQIFALLALMTYAGAWAWFRFTVGDVARRTLPTHLHQLSEADRTMLQSRLQTAVIVCLAFLEAPVLYGLVNSFINTAFPTLFEALAVASLTGMVLLRLRGFPSVFELMDRLG